MKFAILFLALLANDPIEGIYSTVSDDGYSGSVVIRKFGDGYSLQTSTHSEGKLGYTISIGVMVENRLSTSWKAGEAVGVTVYDIHKDGSMTGRWMMLPGNGELKTERLKKLGPLPKADSGL